MAALTSRFVLLVIEVELVALHRVKQQVEALLPGGSRVGWGHALFETIREKETRNNSKGKRKIIIATCMAATRRKKAAFR